MATKTNIEYLRELISDHIGEKDKDEALEFLGAIENEFSEIKEENDDLEKQVDHLRDEVTAKENEIDEKDTAITELNEQSKYEDKIDTGFPKEPLRWSCGNLSIKSMMEDLEEALKQSSPLEISSRLKNK